MLNIKVPFKTPVDYFNEILDGDYNNINHFKELLTEKGYCWDIWKKCDCDLHVYPYTKAVPAMLSVGCPNQCSYCPTAQTHKGKIHHGDPEIILPPYVDGTLHFMDENFFYNDMEKVLPLLKKYNIKWLAMSDYHSTQRVLEKYGEEYLYDCGLRVVEMGLENVSLYMKVKRKIHTKTITIYYLNMTCLPGETKESIQDNAAWMRDVSLKNPIHFNNGLWYACGQFFYPYTHVAGGIYLSNNTYARTMPTWIPNSLGLQDYEIIDLEKTNLYNQLVYGKKIYNPKMTGCIKEFISGNQDRAAWLLTGIRCGGIK